MIPATSLFVAVSIMALQLPRLSYTGFSGETVSVFTLYINGFPLIFVTFFGSSNDFTPVHPRNAFVSISVTESGMVNEVALKQNSNALSPIFVILDGISIDVIFVPANAYAGISVIPFGILNDVNDRHSPNTYGANSVTPSGMCTLFKFLHS